jgi:hypothetical protein
MEKPQLIFGPLAQLAEQRTFNPWVVGSIPTGPTHSLVHLQDYSLHGKDQEEYLQI